VLDNVQTTQQRSFWSPISSIIVGKKKSPPGLTIDKIQRSEFMHVGKNTPTPTSNTMHKTKKQIIDNKHRGKDSKNDS
jgi:hypothetical protein